ncbi:hypothetical protein DS831_01695 [Bombilactobacillus bombi]|uniref:histidine kinase n=1 Tax=Bombilactobacillus bombi TaxID=1303590 RepID=A0A417ZJE0_9LACO|nr:HAMP domain-containing sensor histidine kinase [Bombilactobacillus bombi]RHW52067.1 hypothetical protein DS831_01695 [Bombilactobacillus bombi]
MGNKSLKQILILMSLLEVGYTILLVLGLVGVFNFSLRQGWVYPANYPEQQVSQVKKDLQKTDGKQLTIPNIYEYRLEQNGHLIHNTLPKHYYQELTEARHKGYAQTHTLFAPRIFWYLTQQKTHLILSYRLTADFTSARLRHYLPSAEMVGLLTLGILWIIGLVVIISWTVTMVNQELKKITFANQQIQNLNLNFTEQQSDIKEIELILQSINQMKSALQKSLEQQWSSQQQLQQLVQDVTHDIRTPITLIKGNLELLEEKAVTNQQQALIKDANNGVQRLEEYVAWLKVNSHLQTSPHTTEKITQDVIKHWLDWVSSLARAKQLTIKVIRMDESDLQVNLFQVAQAFQNIILNSVEFSQSQGILKLDFCNQSDSYLITVLDNGPGFSEATLTAATKRYYTQRAQKNEHMGLGLTIAQQIMSQNNGRLVLKNEYYKQQISGGKVQLVFNK